MTTSLVVLSIAAGLASALLTTRSILWSRILKIAASTAMVAIVVTGNPILTAYTMLVAAGLAASWFGDLFLSFTSQRAFMAGLISFATAHLLYTAGFSARSTMDMGALVIAGVIMAVAGTAILRWLAPFVPERLRIPVAFYIGVIAVMVVTSFGSTGALFDPRIPAAAVLFMISDLFVARQQFVVPTPMNRIVGLPIYYAAQTLFAVTAIISWT